MSDPNGAGGHDRGLAPGDLVDEADDESFPASDPPSFTPTHAGSPDHRGDRADGPAEGGG